MNGRGTLGISENGKYFTEGDKPFFWLGDTAWLMLQKLTEEEVYVYLRNRKELSYNVIQTVLAHSLPGRKMLGSLADGMKDVTKPDYWEFCDRIFRMAEEMGVYLGVLPSWGSLVKEGILDAETMEEYAHFLGKRFKEYKNVIWILGGDVRGDVRGEESIEVFRNAARILKQYNPERLVGFHPFGRTSSSQWFSGEDWLDFHMFQSGHRRYDQEQLGEWDDNAPKEEFYGEDSWKYVLQNSRLGETKPILDGEPSYEGIPQGLHNPRNSYWEEWDARRYAYWAVFAGAAGHTYGNNAIMQFHHDMAVPGSYGVREVWKDALHYPGAAQIRHLKELVLSVDFVNGKPAEELLLFGQKERYHRIAVYAGAEYILCYDYMGDEFALKLSGYEQLELDAYWMNPQDGSYSFIETVSGKDKWMASPLRRKGMGNDWVLVMKKKTAGGKRS